MFGGGPAHGAIAEMLRAFPHAAVLAPGQSAELAEWLLSQTTRAAVPPDAVFDAAAHRASSLATFSALVRSR